MSKTTMLKWGLLMIAIIGITGCASPSHQTAAKQPEGKTGVVFKQPTAKAQQVAVDSLAGVAVEDKRGAQSARPNTETFSDGPCEITLSNGWVRVHKLPEGMELGFEKAISTDARMTICLHYEQIPEGFAKLLSDQVTSDMERQCRLLVLNRFPDAQQIASPPVKVNGRVLFDMTYDVTDHVKGVRKRFACFVAEPTQFVIECSAPASMWDTATADFDGVTTTIKPREWKYRSTFSQDKAVSEAKASLPTLLSTFPSEWSCSVADVRLSEQVTKNNPTLEITLAFDRSDVRRIYGGVKTLLEMIAEGKSDSDLNSAGIQCSPAEASGFLKYLGQAYGFAWRFVGECNPPIQKLQLTVLSPARDRVGSIRMDSKDIADLVSGRISISDRRRFGSMYEFIP